MKFDLRLWSRITLFFFVFTIIGSVVPQGFAQNAPLSGLNTGQGSSLSSGVNQRTVRSFGSSTTGGPSSALSAALRSGIGVGGVQGVYYQIHILGEVYNPGTYKIAPSDRLSDALRYAGGVKANGSQRSIQLRRQGKYIALDYFLYETKGALSNNPYLMENDVVFVPLKKGEFLIEGPVKRPGSYEMKNSKVKLSSAVQLAGGFSTGLSSKQPIRIIRYNSNEKKELLEVGLSNAEMSRFLVKKGDIVVVPHVLLANKDFDYNIQRIPGDNIFYPTINDNVYVIGAVSFPGPYPFQPNFTYKDYVGLAGPLKGSNVRRARILNVDGKKVFAKKVKEINPGDTILVPDSAVTFTKFIGWFNTLSNMALTTFIFYDRFKD